MHDDWRPRCGVPRDLVRPVRIDPTGAAGPTRHQARRGLWERVGFNLYLPAGTERARVEQRIIEQAARLPEGVAGAVTGWAALRLWGAAFFDGLDVNGRTRLPVPLVCAAHLSDTTASTVSRRPVDQVWLIAGIPVVSPAEALSVEVARRGELRAAVAAIDMACAAPVTSLERLSRWLERQDRTRRLVADALVLASEHAVSPPEVQMRMTWRLDAGWPAPLVNRDVFDLRGGFLGRPDLLDPVRGVFGEYDGAHHRDRERHRADTARAERLLGAGLEGFAVVAGDGPAVQLQRMASALRRAERRTDAERGWTLEAPPGWPREFTADEKLDHWDFPV
ncbi:hypothetical protein [Nocardioides montaniterrae]